MNVLFSVHLYGPKHNAGAENYIHTLGKYLITQGHEVKVLLWEAGYHNITDKYEYEGVTVYPLEYNKECDLFNWADVVLSHLGFTSTTWEICKLEAIRKPFIFVSHNSSDTYDYLNNQYWPSRIIYNSQWIKDLLQYQKPNIVLHPPMSECKVDRSMSPEEHEYITLINCNERKGGSMVKRIAELMPDYKFLFVSGAYDDQVLPDLPNVKILKNTDDILPVYKETRIILMPSAYESWGSVATEAMSNGIPVICMPTPGLLENCGGAGIYVDSDNLREWRKSPNHEEPAFNFVNDADVMLFVNEIKALADSKNYFRMSRKCRDRAAELDPRKELEAVEKFMLDATEDYKHF